VEPCATVAEAVRDADCVAILALHRPFEDIDFAGLPVADSCVVLDGRAYYSKEKIAQLRSLGVPVPGDRPVSARHAVVTGGCGFVGSHLVESLASRGYEVTVLDGVPFPADVAGRGEGARAAGHRGYPLTPR